MTVAKDLDRSTAIARLLKDRSPEGLEALLRTHGDLVHAVAYSIVSDFHAAEDVTAETMLTAWEKIGSLKDERRVRPWLLRIATRHALQHVRRRRRPIPMGHRAYVQDGMEAAAADRITLRGAMDELPDRMRAVITLRYLADLSVDQIAEVIARSPNTVKTELRLGLQRLRHALADTDFEE